MHIRLDRSGRPESLAQLLEEVCSLPDVRGLMILAADGNGFTPQTLDPVLQRCRLPLEIGNNGKTFLQLYNNTVVLGALAAP